MTDAKRIVAAVGLSTLAFGMAAVCEAMAAVTGQTLPTRKPWKPNPPRVVSRYLYWMQPPPTQSERCTWWVQRIEGGFVPNRRISALDNEDATEFYGVHAWEYLNVLAPLINRKRGER